MNNQKETYKKFQINKKCKHLTKNIFSSIILRRKLNPIVIYLLNNDQEIENYIKCIKNSENVNFKLKHDLTKSKMKGKSARIMKRISKYEEKILLFSRSDYPFICLLWYFLFSNSND